jgi:predicted Zn-dependent protease
LVLLNTHVLLPAWTRGQERDADLIGIDLLARAGWSPQAMISLLRKHQKIETERAADRRRADLDEELVGVDVDGEVRDRTESVAGAIGLGDKGIGDFAGGTVGRVFEWGARKVDDTQRSHPRTEERLATAEHYVARAYPGSEARPRQAEAWEAAKEREGTAEVLENYIAALDASERLARGDLAVARKLSRASLTGPTRAHAYPNYVEAVLDLAIGGDAGREMALAAYDTALSGPEPAGTIYAEASALYLRSGKSEQAVAVLESGYRRLQEPPNLTVPLIHMYRVVGRHDDARRVANRCAERWPKLSDVCIDAAR